MKVHIGGATVNQCEGDRKSINSDLWHACAGPLVSLPPVGSYVVYFPQGHSEQVAASMQKDADAHIPNYPNLPPKLICLLHNVTLHADAETDEVYAQMTLQPVNTYDKEALLASDLALKPNRPQTEFFCKTLTASDTSTHGGFSVPRRAAEKIFPPLDFSMQPPAQELVARDLHDNTWTFRHIYRGQPKRHLLTTGWSLFVSGKKLFAGDSVLFIRDEKQQLLLGIRRANRQPTNISSSVLSSDSMHIGILAAAAHAAANNSPFTVFYNPRASPSEFVIPLAKYNKAVYSNQISLGMRFRMTFETEESGTRRYMGTITGISDLDPVRWKNSPWRNLQVGWDESTAGERRNRVSIWEIEPVAAPFFICPPPFFRTKRPRQPGLPDDDSTEIESLFRRTMPWLGEEFQPHNSLIPGLSLVQWMNMQQSSSITNSSGQSDYIRSLTGPTFSNLAATDLSRQFGLQNQMLQSNAAFNVSKPSQQSFDHLSKLPVSLNPLGTVNRPQQQVDDIGLHQRQNFVNHALHSTQAQAQSLLSQSATQNISVQSLIQSQQSEESLMQVSQQQNHQQKQQQGMAMNQLQNNIPGQLQHRGTHPLSLPDHQMQLQLLQKLQRQQQQQSLPQQQQQQQQQQHPPFSQNSLHLPQMKQFQEHQKHLIDEQKDFSNSSVLDQQQATSHQVSRSAQLGMQYPQSDHSQLLKQSYQKLQQQGNGLPDLPGSMLSTTSSMLLNPSHLALSAAIQSGRTDDMPSCSASPSSNSCAVLPQSFLSCSDHKAATADDMVHSGATILTPGTLDAISNNNASMLKDVQSDGCIKSSLSMSKGQGGITTPQAYVSGPQQEYLDTSSSGTSACLSQSDGSLPQTFVFPSLTPSSLFKETIQEGQVPPDQRNNVLFGVNIDGSMGLASSEPLMYLLPEAADTLASYGASKEVQEYSSFSVPDVPFSTGGVSMDSTVNDSSFLNGSWAPPPQQYQRMRTFTKVYKRGAVGRSIDIARYSGYDELKQDLARRFGIEGQLEDRYKVGWKLVYVDHENDVLLVGDDPWEEFVNCVRCIKILSPQEVQQMSLDGDLSNNVLANQACSSSDGGNAWRGGGQCDQRSGNPSTGSYDQ